MWKLLRERSLQAFGVQPGLQQDQWLTDAGTVGDAGEGKRALKHLFSVSAIPLPGDL